MQTIIYYHRSDLDGHCSGAVAQRAYPDAQMIGVEYGDEILVENFKDNRIILVDFCFEPHDTMIQLFKDAAEVIWIDHHRTAINWYENKCVLKSGQFHDQIDFSKISAVLLEGQAACELAWQFFFPDEEVPWGVNMLARYDVWQQHTVPSCLEFQYGMRLQSTNPRNPQNKVLWSRLFEAQPNHNMVMPNWIEQIIHDGEVVLDYQTRQNHRMMNGAFEATLNLERVGIEQKLRLICVNASGLNSLAFDGFYKPEKHDGCATFSMLSDKRWRFTLYSPDNSTDLSEVAKVLGGGGHPGACGFVVENDHFVVDQFFGYEPFD